MATRHYPGDGITVHWDSELCIHSGVCARGLPEVFRPSETPWVRVDGAQAPHVAAVIDACPSRALTYDRSPAADPEAASRHQETPMSTTDPATDRLTEPAAPTVTVTVETNGPYEVTGGVQVVAADGTVLKSGQRVFLCRCGHSAKKPFCDGSHRREGFVDDGPTAVTTS